jgi:hypothetical protein
MLFGQQSASTNNFHWIGALHSHIAILKFVNKCHCQINIHLSTCTNPMFRGAQISHTRVLLMLTEQNDGNCSVENMIFVQKKSSIILPHHCHVRAQRPLGFVGTFR